MRCHLTPVRMAIIKSLQIINAGKGVEKRELVNCWWECTLVQQLLRTVRRFLKKLKIEFPYDPLNPLLGIQLKKTLIQKDTCTQMFIATLFTITKTRKKLKCSSTEKRIKNMLYIQTMEQYPAIEKSKTMPFKTKWILSYQILSY